MEIEETHNLGSEDALPAAVSAESLPLSAALRARTVALHTEAERSGVVNAILRGNATRYGYAMLLRNLLPAYDAMEQGLQRHRKVSTTGLFARPEIYRSSALYTDLAALYGDDWAGALPLLPAGRKYGKRVAEAAQGDGSLLIAHAYARYMGDLSGGQVLKRLLKRSPGLTGDALSFYDYPRITDPAAFKADFREALDRAGDLVTDVDAVVQEGAVAFTHNIAVSNAVLANALSSRG